MAAHRVSEIDTAVAEEIIPEVIPTYAGDLDLIQATGESIGLQISLEQAQTLLKYLACVLNKNKVLNLTAIKDWDRGVILHIIDSILMAPEFSMVQDPLDKLPFLDMGSGGGIPGVPLGILFPDRHGILCDATRKKMDAVSRFIQELGLTDRLTTESERLEVLPGRFPKAFGCVVARAVAPMGVLMEYATPLMAPGASLIITKGVPSDDEVAYGKKVAKVCGLEYLGTSVRELPSGMGTRTIMRYVKSREASVKLPRAIGVASRVPLV